MAKRATPARLKLKIMIFDISSKNYEQLVTYMGEVEFLEFRKTDYYYMEVIKPVKKELFLTECGLNVFTPDEILSNWKPYGRTKFHGGVWYIHRDIMFNVEHLFRHQNYTFKVVTNLSLAKDKNYIS